MLRHFSSRQLAAARRIPPRARFGALHGTRSFHVDTDVLTDLEARGLIQQVTSPEKLRDAVKQRQVVYLGIDPTAKYLHVGHLLPFLCLFHFQIRGHGIIPLIGGATGLVGDPSGRNTERPLSEASVVENNTQHLVSGISKFFSGAIAYASKRLPPSNTPVTPPEVQNNLSWFKDMGFLEFLRTVGVNSRVNTMLARESVQSRLSSQQGISFTEFTYQLLQGYDFYTLHKNHACTVQLGGSDQWGNILAGIDLINKLDPNTQVEAAHTERVFGITMPLLTTPSGEKFGKSAGNAVALKEEITSVFDFYQFFLRTPDSHVGQYLKMFTLLPISQIDDVMHQHQRSPEMRTAQRLLACEVTELVHGDQAVNRAQAASTVLFDSNYSAVKSADVILALKGDPRLQRCELSELLDTPIAKLASKYKLVASNSAAKQLIAAKGLYINNVAVQDNQQQVQQNDLIDGALVILRSGAQKQLVLAIN